MLLTWWITWVNDNKTIAKKSPIQLQMSASCSSGQILFSSISSIWEIVMLGNTIYNKEVIEYHFLTSFSLTKAQVERLPRRKFRQTRSTMHESCHICLCDFENGQEVRYVVPIQWLICVKLYRLTTCKHDFHTTCLQPWVEKHKTCPGKIVPFFIDF